jgi:hypothetical protein
VAPVDVEQDRRLPAAPPERRRSSHPQIG